MYISSLIKWLLQRHSTFNEHEPNFWNHTRPFFDSRHTSCWCWRAYSSIFVLRAKPDFDKIRIIYSCKSKCIFLNRKVVQCTKITDWCLQISTTKYKHAFNKCNESVKCSWNLASVYPVWTAYTQEPDLLANAKA